MRCDLENPAAFFSGFGLLGTNLNRKALSAFLATACENFTAVLGFHAFTIAVRLHAFLLTGLPRTFH
jgi:hypothetical protein